MLQFHRKKGAFLGFALLLAISTGSGCTLHIRGMALVNAYCIGKNGVLLTGPQVAACCICKRPGNVPAASSSAGSSATAGGASTSTTVSSDTANRVLGLGQGLTSDLVNSLQCEPKDADPNETVRDTTSACPTGIEDILTVNETSAANTFQGIRSIGQAIQSLVSGGSTVGANGGPGAVVSTGVDTSQSNPILAGERSAAKASDSATGSGSSPNSTAAASGVISSLNNPTAAKAAKSGGGSGSSSGSENSGGIGANSSTSSSAATAALATGGSDPNASSGAYASGGGAGAGGFGSDSGGLGEGRGISLGSGNGSAEMAFGKGGASGGPGDGTILPINDPEDYFTRLDLSVDLFKDVTKRYQQIDIKWAH